MSEATYRDAARVPELAQDNNKATRSRRRLLIAVAAMGTLIYLGTAWAVGSVRIIEAAAKLGWLGCGLVFGLSALNYGIRFERWQLFLVRLGHRLPSGRHLLYYLSGFAFTVSPAKAGEAIRSLYLNRYGITYAESIAALFVERALDLLSIVLLASLIVFERPSYQPLVAGTLLVVLALLWAATRSTLPAFLQSYRSRLEGHRIARALEALMNMLRSSDRLLQPRILLVGTAAGAVAWGAEGLGFWLICRGLHVEVHAVVAIGIYAVAVLAGSAAFFLPAGLGGMELVMTTLLAAQGAPLHEALVATLLCRVATLWFAVVLGMIAAATVELGSPHARLEAVP